MKATVYTDNGDILYCSGDYTGGNPSHNSSTPPENEDFKLNIVEGEEILTDRFSNEILEAWITLSLDSGEDIDMVLSEKETKTITL